MQDSSWRKVGQLRKEVLLRLATAVILLTGLTAGILSSGQPVSANGNHAPVYNGGLANQTYNRNQAFSDNFSCLCFTDADGDHLTYTAAQTDGNPLPGWLNFEGPSRTFSGATENTTGTFNIRVTAADTHAATATGDFTIQVQNGAPQFNTPIPDQSCKEGVPFSYTVPAGTFSDPDGDSLSYTCTVKKSKPDWLNIDEATLHFWGTPVSDGTSWKITITASDGIGGTVNGDFLLSRVSNLPPVYNGGITADQVWTAGHPYLYQFGAGCFTDPEGDPLNYSIVLTDGRPVEENYPWIHFDGSMRTFSGTTGNNLNEVIHIFIQASDPYASTSVSFNITVDGDYNIQASAGSHGAISPPDTTYALAGSSLTYTITPDTCYSVADVLVDGISVGPAGSYTFSNIRANHTIAASFTAVVVNSVNPPQANQGQTLTVTINGANLWDAASLNFGTGITIGGFTVNNDIQITANIGITTGASEGAHAVSVTTPAGAGTLSSGLYVNQLSQQVPTSGGTATFATGAGSISNLAAVADNTLPATGKPTGVAFPYGLFSFNINNLAPGTTVTVTITAPG